MPTPPQLSKSIYTFYKPTDVHTQCIYIYSYVYIYISYAQHSTRYAYHGIHGMTLTLLNFILYRFPPKPSKREMLSWTKLRHHPKSSAISSDIAASHMS